MILNYLLAQSTSLTSVSQSAGQDDPAEAKSEDVPVENVVESVDDGGVDVVRVLEVNHEEHTEEDQEYRRQPARP